MKPIDPTLRGPTWYGATALAVPERVPLTYALDVDVCVIGGGLAGLTTARELARSGWSVGVLEAERFGSSASGRNAGFVAPGFAERLEAIVDRVGLRRAKELWELSAGGVAYVRDAIRDAAMPGVEPVEGRLTVSRIDDEDAVLRHVAMLRVEFATDADVWPTEQVRDVLRTSVYFQAAHLPDAFHIHPLNYSLGLAAAAEAAGARLFEGTPALAVDAAGVRKRIDTPDGRVRASHIVLAGGPHLGEVFPLVSETIVPVSTYLAVTAPLGERLLDAVRYSGAVADTRRAGDYYRIVGGDRLMWGGRITTRVSEPRWLKRLMRRDIQKVYPQLGEIEIEHAWSGIMSYAVHKMPQIGELLPGVWLAGAFGGHGLNTTAMAGDLIARAIADGDDRWRLFSDYELVWAGGRFGRAAAQAVYWSMQARDAVAERLSRYREAARRRAAERTKRRAAEDAARAEAERAREAREAQAREIEQRMTQERPRYQMDEENRGPIFHQTDDHREQAGEQASEHHARRVLEAAGRAVAEHIAEAQRRAAEAAHSAIFAAQDLATPPDLAPIPLDTRSDERSIAERPSAEPSPALDAPLDVSVSGPPLSDQPPRKRRRRAKRERPEPSNGK